MNIYICDDELIWIQIESQYVKEYLNTHKINQFNIQTAIKPECLLNLIQTQQGLPNIYFLDIELKTNMDGITLAHHIRKIDPQSYIIFVTTHSELAFLTFKFKINAFDYIIKDEINVSRQISECLNHIINKSIIRNNSFEVQMHFHNSDETFFIKLNEILFIESIKNSHKISIHHLSGLTEAFDSISSVAERCKDSFELCHKSILVNLNHVIGIQHKNKSLIMENGELCPCSVRQFPKIVKRVMTTVNH